MSTTPYHNPVLLDESIEALNIQPNGIYVDATFGGGGHSSLILRNLGQGGRLLAFDQDPDARQNALKDSRFTLIAQNFRQLRKALRLYGVTQVDGILADFGVSSHQFDAAERGFSFRFDAELDMRMNPETPLTAAGVINQYDESELRRILSKYGEVPRAGYLAHLIAKARAEKDITSTFELLHIIEKAYSPKHLSSVKAQVFQALRIEVNDEMGALEEFLEQIASVLKPEGRFVSITYHSLEDRMVKHLIRSGNTDDEPIRDDFGKRLLPFKGISRKPIVPSDQEISINPRARSAKMRIAERL
ncbi:MAG: 16S rRNA (cytosine(1402)-N(4))-methyltransferase RsmH [Flavobacteriales bacterium]|nr:MAG: 16S rRNA (cytosine(1402)-N(4))-methyltransferase RsmH [Flavobacteriales bacterium]